jgi:NADP-dependent 3-hydroxy acid dehydrogenase YdfG
VQALGKPTRLAFAIGMARRGQSEPYDGWHDTAMRPAVVSAHVGARVTIASRSAEKLSGALARLGNRASGECVDVTNKPMLERFFAGLGPFDHLAVTVGDPLLSKQIMELTDEEARSAFEVRF